MVKKGVFLILSIVMLVLFSNIVLGTLACKEQNVYVVLRTGYVGGKSEKVVSSPTTMDLSKGCLGNALSIKKCLFIGAPAGYKPDSFVIEKATVEAVPVTLKASSRSGGVISYIPTAVSTAKVAASQAITVSTAYTLDSADPAGAFGAAYACNIAYKGDMAAFTCSGKVCGGTWTNSTEFTPANILAKLNSETASESLEKYEAMCPAIEGCDSACKRCAAEAKLCMEGKVASHCNSVRYDAAGAMSRCVPEECGLVEEEEEKEEEGKEACSANPDDCKTEDDCKEGGYSWWDDKCSSGKEPICDKDNPENCKTKGDCNNAGNLYWDNALAKCVSCLSECIAGTDSENPLKAKCCISKCSPMDEKELIGVADSCVEEDGRKIYYKYSCNGKSGNAIAKEEGTCDGIAKLEVLEGTKSTSKILYGKDYNLKLFFDKEVNTNMLPILYLSVNGTVMDNIVFIDCTENREGVDDDEVYCADSVSVTVKGLEGNLGLELEAKTNHNEQFSLEEEMYIIDTIHLANPSIKYKMI